MATVAKKKYKIIIHIFFILLCLLYVLPLWLVVSISFSSEASITANNSGYSLIPKDFSTEAYKLAFQNPQSMVSAYWITASQAILGTVLSCIVAGMVAYPLSRTSFAYKKPITFLIFFTMLFGGGMIPTYIIYTNWYHLLDTYWIPTGSTSCPALRAALGIRWSSARSSRACPNRCLSRPRSTARAS